MLKQYDQTYIPCIEHHGRRLAILESHSPVFLADLIVSSVYKTHVIPNAFNAFSPPEATFEF